MLDAAITVVAPVTSWLLLLLSGGLIRRQQQLLLLDVAGRVATSSVDGGSCIVADGPMAAGSMAVSSEAVVGFIYWDVAVEGSGFIVHLRWQ